MQVYQLSHVQVYQLSLFMALSHSFIPTHLVYG